MPGGAAYLMGMADTIESEALLPGGPAPGIPPPLSDTWT